MIWPLMFQHDFFWKRMHIQIDYGVQHNRVKHCCYEVASEKNCWGASLNNWGQIALSRNAWILISTCCFKVQMIKACNMIRQVNEYTLDNISAWDWKKNAPNIMCSHELQHKSIISWFSSALAILKYNMFKYHILESMTVRGANQDR